MKGSRREISLRRRGSIALRPAGDDSEAGDGFAGIGVAQSTGDDQRRRERDDVLLAIGSDFYFTDPHIAAGGDAEVQLCAGSVAPNQAPLSIGGLVEVSLDSGCAIVGSVEGTLVHGIEPDTGFGYGLTCPVDDAKSQDISSLEHYPEWL